MAFPQPILHTLPGHRYEDVPKRVSSGLEAARQLRPDVGGFPLDVDVWILRRVYVSRVPRVLHGLLERNRAKTAHSFSLTSKAMKMCKFLRTSAALRPSSQAATQGFHCTTT